jgi:hypothetical protein
VRLGGGGGGGGGGARGGRGWVKEEKELFLYPGH